MEQDIPGLTPELKAWIEAEIDRRVQEALHVMTIGINKVTRTMLDGRPGGREFIEAIGKKLDTL